jgi:hypothetical protein
MRHPFASASALRSSGALSMRTAAPAISSMETSFQLSPIARICVASNPREAASERIAAPLEHPAGRMSRMERSRLGYSVRWRVRMGSGSDWSAEVLLSPRSD